MPRGYGSEAHPVEWGWGGVGIPYFGRLICPNGAPADVIAKGTKLVAPPSSSPRSDFARSSESESLELFTLRCGGLEKPVVLATNPYRCGNPCTPAPFKLLPADAAKELQAARDALRGEAWGRALASADRAEAMAPGILEPVRIRAQAFEELGRLDDSIAAWDRVIAADPGDHVAWYGRSFALFRKGDLAGAEKALADLDAQLEKDDPLYGQTACARTALLERMGREDDANTMKIELCAEVPAPCCP